MTVFIDTAVIMYAVGAEHPLKAPSAEILRRVADGRLRGTTSAEVIQEIVHRFVHARRPEQAAQIASHALAIFSPVIPVGTEVVERLPGLIGRYPSLAARDLVHVATCLQERIETIVSPDRGFDAVVELVRLDPSDPAALESNA
ncbi:MAG: type II toxin-antitoxin system VapC family toxin [Candidatus Limnocylindria bacterium]